MPAQFQRMEAEDLLSVCFPSQVACLENVVGDREIPDHPLVSQTIADCLRPRRWDADGFLRRSLREDRADARRETGASPHPPARHLRKGRDRVTIGVRLCSPHATARPYAFLDDAPLEERRTQAVMEGRRWLGGSQARDLAAALDPAAIDAGDLRSVAGSSRTRRRCTTPWSFSGFVTAAEVSSHSLLPLPRPPSRRRSGAPRLRQWEARRSGSRRSRLPELLAVRLRTCQARRPPIGGSHASLPRLSDVGSRSQPPYRSSGAGSEGLGPTRDPRCPGHIAVH